MMMFAVLSGLVLSASCMVLHQPQVPQTYGLQGVQYHDTPNYNFAYDVNDAYTGDIKSQHESRRGDTVLGQYSLLQPDGVRRTVDYRADQHAGFRATVNNEGRAVQHQVQVQAQVQAQAQAQAQAQVQAQAQAQANVEAHRSSIAPANLGAYIWPAPTPSPTPAPAVAVSRSSIVQTFSHGNNNPWY